MSRYKAYEKYKDSGIEWLGDIPEHWRISKHKYIAKFQKGKNPSLLMDNNLKGTLKYLSMDFLRGNSSSLLFAKAESNSYVAKKNQTLIIWDGSNAGEFVKAEEGIVSSTMAASELISSIEINYYWFACVCLEPEMRRCANGMGIPHVDGEELKESILTIPLDAEQIQIAAFLDHETAKIDDLIDKQQQLIALLKEKRQAVISHAVTKGLNPDVVMKDSGVEWLGDVPAHWDVKKLKYLCSLQTGDKNTEDAIDDGDYPFFVRSQIVERLNSYTADCEAVLTAGDGVGVGKVFHYIVGKFDFHQRVYMMNNFKSVTGKYFFRYLENMFHKVALDGGAKSTVDSLRMPVFMNFQFTVPPKSEQNHIISFIEANNMIFDNITLKTARAIQLLQERRTALISAAVTGKIDVRKWLSPSLPHINSMQQGNVDQNNSK
ncbi:restriction modification system DNA specificity domain-containing protein [Gammaproteobacteria bacterium]|nr:restriction modification system DNA specificity domain-containing protein [Gammaproteobacteria bacterium]